MDSDLSEISNAEQATVVRGPRQVFRLFFAYQVML
jgi:hypothetical protein